MHTSNKPVTSKLSHKLVRVNTAYWSALSEKSMRIGVRIFQVAVFNC